jgi:aspartyl/asparaginyl beta-hydroxylase (cupin superfamily)
MAWKSRYELPVISKLNLSIDINRLKKEVDEYTKNKEWNGFGNEYYHLCKSYTIIPKTFFEKAYKEENDICKINWENSPYRQIGVTEYDETYSLSDRNEMSGSPWDTRVARKDKILDERWYKKFKEDLPPYLTEILNNFKNVHRTRFAELAPQSEVKPHIDYDTTYSIRLHIALTTNDGCVNGGWDKDGNEVIKHIPDDGSVWFVNTGVRHYAKNMGSTPRNHLIIGLDSQEPIDKFL